MGDRLSDGHHQPVLADAVAGYLITDKKGAYLDPTAGGGGLLKILAARLDTEARLYGIDVDPDAVGRTARVMEGVKQFRGVKRAAFADIVSAVRDLEEQEFEGIVIDLGLSSNQLDDPDRGMSYRYDGPLDMRFDPRSDGITAQELVNESAERELARIISEFGEERQAARIAKAIVRERQKGVIGTTAQLSRIVGGAVSPAHLNKTLSRVFQSLRIAVNRELDQLTAVLPAAMSVLKISGRLAIISYHSLEDRSVKRFFQREAAGACTCPPDLPQCVCGAKPTLKILTRKPVLPSDEEIAANPRARSARLRVAEKVA